MGVFIRDGEPKRFRKYPYGPFRMRLVLALLSVLFGVVFAISNLGHLGDRSSSAPFLLGIGMVVVGVMGFFVARWMAKRNL